MCGTVCPFSIIFDYLLIGALKNLKKLKLKNQTFLIASHWIQIPTHTSIVSTRYPISLSGKLAKQ